MPTLVIGTFVSQFFEPLYVLLVRRPWSPVVLAAAGCERFAATVGRIIAHRIILVLGEVAVARVTAFRHHALPLCPPWPAF